MSNDKELYEKIKILIENFKLRLKKFPENITYDNIKLIDFILNKMHLDKNFENIELLINLKHIIDMECRIYTKDDFYKVNAYCDNILNIIS